ncbi:acetyl-CoA acetyltransferase [Bradyrhizobium sp. GM7.3]
MQCGRPLLARQPFSPDTFDQVILGCVNVIADEMNPARVAALRLGMGEDMVAFTVQINCGSGMQSIDTAYRYIREGHADMILAGGTEALSHAPLVWPNSGVRWFAGLATAKGVAAKLAAAFKLRPRYLKPVIGLERGLTDPITDLNMGQTAEVVGHLFWHHPCAVRCLCRREPPPARACAGGRFSQGRSRNGVLPRRKILRP